MSSVRMCDRCGEIFKEGAEGSAVGSLTVIKTDRNGTPYPVQQAQDICPDCGTGATMRPRLALETSDRVSVSYGAEELQQRYEEYIAAKRELEEKFGDVAGS